jgi:hypothetical protein
VLGRGQRHDAVLTDDLERSEYAQLHRRALARILTAAATSARAAYTGTKAGWATVCGDLAIACFVKES